MILIKKVTEAFQMGKPGFLESMKKKFKNKQISRTNITREVIKPEERYFLEIQKYQKIETLHCYENPIDPEKSKKWMKSSIELIDPRTICNGKTYEI